MFISKLENKGAAAVLHAEHTGQLVREYPFLYASAGDLRVEDVESLLNAYKKLVLKYVSLSKAVESTLSHKAQAPSGSDVQSSKVQCDGSQKPRDREDQETMPACSLPLIDVDSGGSQIYQLVMQYFDGDCLQLSTDLDPLNIQLPTADTGNTNGETSTSDRPKETETEQVNPSMHEDGTGISERRHPSSYDRPIKRKKLENDSDVTGASGMQCQRGRSGNYPDTLDRGKAKLRSADEIRYRECRVVLNDSDTHRHRSQSRDKEYMWRV